jgi:hypothetical protein
LGGLEVVAEQARAEVGPETSPGGVQALLALHARSGVGFDRLGEDLGRWLGPHEGLCPLVVAEMRSAAPSH